ncbi:MAG: antibiotic biosynthesis monooxygenase [Pseudomonadales bacterium]|nr:antibiotic biosynthesis monooxygenase [Pseudomonadales bacterium]
MNHVETPCYAVIFTATLTSDTDGYAEMAKKMNALAADQPGFLGVRGVTKNNREITVTYWRTLEDIQAWKEHPNHAAAQALGKSKWYSDYQVEIAKMERGYSHSG